MWPNFIRMQGVELKQTAQKEEERGAPGKQSGQTSGNSNPSLPWYLLLAVAPFTTGTCPPPQKFPSPEVNKYC